MERVARHDIADMGGVEALPRRSGELTFHDEWERRAFALGVALCEQGEFDWNDFRRHLISAICASGETPDSPDPDAPGYYEHWLTALERTLVEQGVLISPDTLPGREES